MEYKMIKVKVPASTANLGAGFDTLGIALNLYNEIEVNTNTDFIKIETYPKNENLEIPEKNLFYIVLKDTLKFLGKNVENLHIKQYNNIPISRGLGSSASIITGAILTAFHIAGKKLTEDLFFNIAYKYENHPDNLLPAWKGGFIASAKTEKKTYFNKIAFPKELKFIAIIPDIELSTEEARKVLPKTVDIKDAIFNIQRVALFISAIQNKRYDLLKIAVEDRLHQPYRKKLIPGFDEVVNEAYKEGALAVYLSGAGSTIIAISDKNFENIAQAMQDTFAKVEINSQYKILEIDEDGAKIEEV